MEEIKIERRSGLSIRYLAATGILSAAAFVLQMFEFPLPVMPPFIKMDFSDLPALIAAFSMGPVYGVATEFIKNLIHVLFSGSFGVGELSNFLLGAVFSAVAGGLYRIKKTKTGALTASIAGAVAMAALSFPFNLFIVYPVYYNFMPRETILSAYQLIVPAVGSIEAALLMFNVPFTFLKGMADVAITFLVYKHISPIIKQGR